MGKETEIKINFLPLMMQLWQGKKLIALVTLLMLLLAVVYLQFVRQQWTSQAILTLPDAGKVSNYSQSLSVLYYQKPADLSTVNKTQELFFRRFHYEMKSLAIRLENREIKEKLKIEPVTKGNQFPLMISYSAQSPRQAQLALMQYIDQANKTTLDDLMNDLTLTIKVRLHELHGTLNIQRNIAQQKKTQRMKVLQQALRVAQQANIQHIQVRQAETLSEDTLFVLGNEALTALLKHEATRPLPLTDKYFTVHEAILALNSLSLHGENSLAYHYLLKPTLPLRYDSLKPGLILLLFALPGIMSGVLLVLARNALADYRQHGR